MDDLIERLKQIGLNTNESKVYLALLKQHPVTGYELSKNTGLPQARAYETLKSLESKKIVVAMSGKPQTYSPVAPDTILSRFEQDFRGAVDFLRNALPIFTVESVEPVHNLRGADAAIAQVSKMVDEAQNCIFMEVWHKDAPFFEPALRKAAERGVSIQVVSYGEVEYDFAKVYPHRGEKEVAKALGGRWLIMSFDNHLGLVGTAPYNNPDKTPHAVWTKNPAIVMVIQQLIIHDIYLLEVEKSLKAPLEKEYGENLYKLRDKILGDSIVLGTH